MSRESARRVADCLLDATATPEDIDKATPKLLTAEEVAEWTNLLQNAPR